MAQYTVTVAQLIHDGYDVVGKALSDYQCSDETFRKSLNDALIRHYWLDEISCQTADEWAYYLNRAMCEIMPYYDERRKIDMLDIGLDPLISYSEQTTNNSSTQNTGTNEQTTNRNHNETSTRTDDFTTQNEQQSDTTNDDSSNSTVSGSDKLTGESTTNTKQDSSGSSNSSSQGFSRHYEPATSTTGGASGGILESGLEPGACTAGDDNKSEDNSSDTGSVTTDATTNTNNTTTREQTTSNSGKTTTSGTVTTNGKNGGTSENTGSGESTDTVNGSTSNTTTNNSEGTRTGTTEPKFELMRKYREVIENITMMIIKDQRVQNCFMSIFEPLGGTFV